MMEKIFSTPLPIIGYVQLDELTKQNYDYACAKGVLDVIQLERGGIDALVIENYAEPELGALASPESKKYLDLYCARVKEIVKKTKIGINVLQADVLAALELAQKYHFDFVHADIYADVVRSRETKAIIQVDLKQVSEYKQKINPPIPLLATIKPAHAYELCGFEDVEKSALRAVEYGADAVVVVGQNSSPPAGNDIKKVKSVVTVPVGAGSGITDETIADYMAVADFFLVSGFFKYNGIKSNPVDEERVRRLIKRRNELLPLL